MKIRLVDGIGFCFGVKRAVELAEEAARSGGPVYCIGPLIHNPQEVARLVSLGIQPVEDLEDVTVGTVILRAHGTPPEIVDELVRRGMRVVDATCPHVRTAQEAARALFEEGYQVVIVGDRDHPEVKATRAYTQGAAIVVQDVEEAARLPSMEKVGVVPQTTVPPDLLARVTNALRSRAGEVKTEATICNITSRRQEATRRLAEECDLVLVVGGRGSANTLRLAEIAREAGCPVRLVETAAEVEPEWFRGSHVVGITAGTSTPEWIIKEVLGKVEEINRETVEQYGPALEPRQGEIYDESLRVIKEGEIIKGRVVSIDDNGVMVDVGYKSEGIIPPNEVSRKQVQPSEILRPGDEIMVYVLSVDGQEGGLKLSKKRADEEIAWQTLKEAQEQGRVIQAEVLQEVKGGLVVDVGLRGFVPASQIERGYVNNLSKYVGQTLRLKVLELDRAKNRVVLSQRVVLEEERERLRNETWASIAEGQVRRGVVKGITDFGVFVDIGGVDGLLHVSELSWGRVNHPSEVVKEGDQIDVMVLRIDREKAKISLGLKQVLPDPWTTAAKKYPADSIVEGKVTRLAPFGAFVELEPGVEGLVHISEMSTQRVSKPDEVVTPGQRVRVKVLKCRPEERRISLSLKEVEQGQQRVEPQEYAAQKSEGVTLGDVFGDILGEAKNGAKE